MIQINFKLFVSSTFVDFQHERAWLHNIIFPQIKRKCEESGFDFQSVDLRWGVSQEAGLDQNTMDICLNELGHCRDVSENPFLLILLGDRYGWRPLPHRVSEVIFLAWGEAMSQDDRALFNQWYSLDNNTIQPSYALRSRRGICEDDAAWFEHEKKMRLALDLVLQNRPQDEQERYSFSATHHEIVKGLEGDGKNNCLIIQRKIHSECEVPDHFADSGESLVKQAQLSASLADQVDESKFYQLAANWQQDGFDSDYQEKFCQVVLDRFDQAINSLFKKRSEPLNMVERHKLAFEACLNNYVARPSVENQIFEAIACSVGKPAVLVGAGGTGKSSLVTGVAAQDTTEKIVRYIGLDQESCQSSLVLESILQELGEKYGQEVIENLPQRDSEKLTQALNRIPHCRPLTLYIDALDRIVHQSGDVWFSWLPLQLPPQVKVLVTVIAGKVEERLQGLLETVNFLVLDKLAQEDAAIMLKQWMAEKGRKLQSEQSQHVIALATTHPAPPLMLKMTSIAAQYWDHQQRPDFLSTSNKEMVADIYHMLAYKRHHGIELTKAVTGLIALSRSGLPESVLLAMLNKFKPVTDEYRIRYPFSPATEGLPAIIWSRLRLDMVSLLLEHQENGERVLYYSHQQFVTQTQSILSQEYQAQLKSLMIRHYSDRFYFPFWYKEIATPNQFVLKELPWQLQNAQDIDGLSTLLSDVSFLIAKCSAAQLDDLLNTFYWLRTSGNSNSELAKIERFIVKLSAISEKNRSCYKFFLQSSYELPDKHPLKVKVQLWLNEGHCNWLWIASKHPLASLESTIELNSDLSDISVYHAINESLFAVGVKEGVIQLFDTNTTRLITELIGHSRPVNKVFNGYRNDLVSVSSDNTIRIWDIDTGRETLCITSASLPINVSLIRIDQLIVQEKSRVTIHDYRTGKVIMSREVNPKRKLLQQGKENKLALSSKALDQLLKVKDLEQPEDAFDLCDALPKFSLSGLENLNLPGALVGGMQVYDDKLLFWANKSILVLNANDLSTISAAEYEDYLDKVVLGRDSVINVITKYNAILSYDLTDNQFSEVAPGSGYGGFHHIDKQRYFLWHGQASADDKRDVVYRVINIEDWELPPEKQITVSKYDSFFRQAGSSVFREVLQTSEDSLVLVTMYSAYKLDLVTSELTALFIDKKLHLTHAFMLDKDRIVITRAGGELFIFSIEKREIVCEVSPWLGSIDFTKTNQVTHNTWLMQIEKGNPFLFDKQRFIDELDGGQLMVVKGQKVEAVTSFGDGYTAEVIRPELNLEHVHIYGPDIPEGRYLKQAGHNLNWQKEGERYQYLSTHIQPFGSLIIAWGENGLVTLRGAHSQEPISTWQTKERNIKRVEVLSSSKERFTNSVIEPAPIAVVIMTEDSRAYCWLPYLKESLELISPHLYDGFTWEEEQLAIYGDGCFTLFDTSTLALGHCKKVFARDQSDLEEERSTKLKFVQPIPEQGVISKFYNHDTKQSVLITEFADETKESCLITSDGDVCLNLLGGFGLSFFGVSAQNKNEFGFYHFSSSRFYSFTSQNLVKKLSLGEGGLLLIETDKGTDYYQTDEFESGLKPYRGDCDVKPEGKRLRIYSDMLRYTPSGQVDSSNSLDWLISKGLNYVKANSDGTIVVHNSVCQSITLQAYFGNQPLPLNQLTEGPIQSDTITVLRKKAEIKSIRVRLQQLSQLLNAAEFSQASMVLKLVDEKLREQKKVLPRDLLVMRNYYYLQLMLWTQPVQLEIAEGLVDLQKMLLNIMKEQEIDLSSVVYITRLLQPLSNLSQVSDENLIQFLSRLKGSYNSANPMYEGALYDMWMLLVEKLLASYPDNIHCYKIDLISAVDRIEKIGLNSGYKSAWEMRAQWLLQALKSRESVDEDKLDNVVRTLPEKFQNLQQKAATGDSIAWLEMGILWGRGEEVEKDLNQARICYEKSAELGSEDALFNLYRMYQTGDGVIKNLNQSIEYLKRAAEKGKSIAQTNLGGVYLSGEQGLKKDWEKAVYWLTLAANNGDDMALLNLAVAYSLGAPEHLKDLNKALDYLSLPINRGNANALRLYEHLKQL